MQADVATHCIHAACARALPYRVNFCPYCGTGQHAGVMNPKHAIVGEELPFVMSPAAPGSPASASPASASASPSTASHAAASTAPASTAASSLPASPAASSVPASPVAAEGAGAAAQHAPAFAQHVPAAAQASAGTEPYLTDEPPPIAAPPPRRVPSGASTPPKRAPVRMRYWVLALALLWGIWIMARPSAKKIDARIDQAITMANECNPSGAQSELVDLRSTKATPAQLQRLQKGLTDAVPICEKRRQRIKAWSDASAATDSALAAGAFDKALARLAQFTRKYGEDSATRELKARIESQRGVKTASVPPLLGSAPATVPAAPAPAVQAPPTQSSSVQTSPTQSSSAQSVRNLVNDAEREMAQANYKAAADRMDICITMVDSSNQQCLAVKARAERLSRELQRCLVRNGDWINDHCQ